MWGFDTQSKPNPDLQGYGELLFITEDGAPQRFVGFCVDSQSGERDFIEGWRVLNENELSAPADAELRARTALSIAQRAREATKL